MATLVLTTIGGALGGPIGAMLGGLIGQSVDREIFKPKGREGPRLNELKVQTSSYGTPLPKLFGALRVAGSVIWATDLVEHRHREGGKGRPTTTSYSYTASFAVALSARPIVGVGRIWADGKLLRGAAGDWKASTGFRLHLGGEDQAPDPLIASAEGIAQAPAHRGIAYAVFEDLELGDFGNRIPSLTFEVHADAGTVTVGGIAAALSGGKVASGDAATPIGGFSAYGDSQRAVIDPLVRMTGAWPALASDAITLAMGPGAAANVGDLGASGDAGVRRRAIAAMDRVPRHVTLSYYDPARDYQGGLQQAVRPGAGTRTEAVELPGALDADTAKGLAEAMLLRTEAERERRTLSTGWAAMAIAPGARVTIAGEPGLWRVTDWTLEKMAVTLELARVAPAPLPVLATPGSFLPAPDAAAGDSIVHAFELPHLGDGALNSPRISIAACGTLAGWRRATLAVSVDGGVRWEAAGTTALPAIIGSIETPPGPASARLEDRHNMLVVELLHDGMALSEADEVALDSGANLALVGEELIQFGSAHALGANRWALRNLRRGRRGTESAIGAGAIGDRFILIEPDTLVQHDIAGSVGEIRVMAVAPGSDAVAETTASRTGFSVTPPSPVGLRATSSADGSVMLSWFRRSRSGWHWLDAVDVPLVEEFERYRLRIALATGEIAAFETSVPSCVLDVAARSGGAVQVEVRQVGSHGLSAPATITVPAMEE